MSRRPARSTADRKTPARSARQLGQVDRLERRLGAPASMREKSSSVLTSLNRRTWLRCTLRRSSPRKAPSGRAQCLFGGPEHQRERRPELVAHVREKGGLGAVDRRQRLGAAAFLFVRARVGEPGRHLADEQVHETAVLLVDAQIRIGAGDEHARRPRLALLANGQRRRRRTRACPSTASANPPSGGEGTTSRRFQSWSTPRPQAAARSSSAMAGAMAAGASFRPVIDTSRAWRSRPEQVDDRERQIAGIAWRARARRRGNTSSALFDAARLRAELLEHAEAALVDDALGLLGHHAEHAHRCAPGRRGPGCTRRCDRSLPDSRCARGTRAAARPTWPRRSRAPCRCEVRSAARSPPRPRARAVRAPTDAWRRASWRRTRRCRRTGGPGPSPSTSRSARSAGSG